MPDRTLSKDLTPGTKLLNQGMRVTLERRKQPDEPRPGGSPFLPGWWLADGCGGLADLVIDNETNGWEILPEEHP